MSTSQALSQEIPETSLQDGYGVINEFSLPETVRHLLKPVASLRLTVVLFVLSIFLVFVGTLAQVHHDIWEVVHGYFRTWVAYVELRVFFPPSFFGGETPESLKFTGGFFFPGGWTIGTLLAANLFAAHLIRFKPQASGSRLLLGLGVTFVGLIVTLLVIASGSMGTGVQDDPFIPYSYLWKIFLTGMGLLWLVLTASIVNLDLGSKSKTRKVQITLSIVSVVFGALLAWLLMLLRKEDGNPLSDSSMRILWQLTQASFASLVLLTGCVMIFKKRGGMVLLHIGVAVLMFSELLVGLIAVEGRMNIIEGETVNYASDMRTAELAIIQASDSQKNRVVVIPKNILNAIGRFESKNPVSRFFSQKPNNTISHDQLPFDVRVSGYCRNATLLSAPSDKEKYPQMAGFGMQGSINKKASADGVSGDQSFDYPATYVTLLKKLKPNETPPKENSPEEKERILGTWLVSCMLPEEQSVTVGDKTFLIALRFKRMYKPYTIHLKDFRRIEAKNTNTPTHFSSIVQLVDKTNKVDREVDIWMNNPLRYGGDTFYQSAHDVDPLTNKEVTSLSVVTNLGWMIPYVACMLVWWGMLYHFAIILVRFSKKETSQKQTTIAKADDTPTPSFQADLPRRAGLAEKLVPAMIVLVFGLWFASKYRAPKVPEGQPNSVSIAKLPFLYQGRVKPFDSFARNNLLVLSKKTELKIPKPNPTTFWGKLRAWLFGNIEKKPASTWIVDLITDQKKADDDKVFRIDNSDVLYFFDLQTEKRKSHLYSFNELYSHAPQLIREIDKLRLRMTEREEQQKIRAEKIESGEKLTKQEKKEEIKALNTGERKLIELNTKLMQYQLIRDSIALPPKEFASYGKQIKYLTDVYDIGFRNTKAPLAVPQPRQITSGQKDELNWTTLAVAGAKVWIYELAKEKNIKTTEEFTKFLLDETVKDHSVSDLVDDAQIEQVLPTVLASLLAENDKRKMNTALFNLYLQKARTKIHDKDVPAQALTAIRQITSSRLQDLKITSLSGSIEKIMGNTDLTVPPEPTGSKLVAVLQAYQNQDLSAYNNAIKAYHQEIDSGKFAEINQQKIQFEAFFNHMSPFYYSVFLYLFAFLLGMFSFIGWRGPLRKSAFWLIVFTFTIHTLAVIGRIYISGRPPVTNLYSSASFIGWATVAAGLTIELIFQIGLGNILASITGAAALGIAHLLSLDGDTITVMQAVLDSQFWLSTHVVCISLGYSATFLAGFIGLYTIAVRTGMFFNYKNRSFKEAKEILRLLYRITYGVICFAIFFSFVGTVLGGLWADDSWGRFWGWDPKENGALIIVIWNALILHARWGGMVKERGFALLAIAGNIVTGWSWFGVNELGVGLHSYGFTEGVLLTLGLFIASQLFIIAIGLIPQKQSQ